MIKEERKNKKLYKKMNRKYHKMFKKMVKDCGPWDYGCIFIFIQNYLKWIQEYYTIGYNVVAMESEEGPTRKELADKLVKLFEEDCKLDYCDCNPETIKKFFNEFAEDIVYLWD